MNQRLAIRMNFVRLVVLSILLAMLGCSDHVASKAAEAAPDF